MSKTQWSVYLSSPAHVSWCGALAAAPLVHGLDHHPAGAAHPALRGGGGGGGGEMGRFYEVLTPKAEGARLRGPAEEMGCECWSRPAL